MMKIEKHMLDIMKQDISDDQQHTCMIDFTWCSFGYARTTGHGDYLASLSEYAAPPQNLKIPGGIRQKG